MLVACTADIKAAMSVDITWEQFQTHADVREFLGEMDDEPFSMISTDDDVCATVELSLMVEAETYDVMSCEVDRLKTDDGSRAQPTPRPIALQGGSGRSAERFLRPARLTEPEFGA
jgi:hypothetical protein